MANIIEIDRVNNIIIMGTTGTTTRFPFCTANRMTYLDGDCDLTSVTDLTTWVGGTANQIVSTDNGDGTVTLSTPQNIHTGASPTFAGASLGTGELTCGSINRVSGTLTLEIGGTAEISITSTASTFGGNIVIPDTGYIGSASDTDAIQIEADGDVVLTQDLGVTGAITASNYTAANLLTACATNAGALDFSAAGKTLTVEDNATVSQDYSSDASPTFAGMSLGTGELTCGSINRATGTLTLEIAGTAEVTITDSATTLRRNLLLPDAGYIGVTSYNAAIQIEADGDVVLATNVGIGKSPALAKLDIQGTETFGLIYKNTDSSDYTHLGLRNDSDEQMYVGISGSAVAGAFANLVYLNVPAGHALGFLVGGTEKVRMASDGKFGVGTTAKTLLTVEGTLTLKEQASADGDTAAYGQLWVKNDTPNILMFTDDAGTDFTVDVTSV